MLKLMCRLALLFLAFEAALAQISPGGFVAFVSVDPTGGCNAVYITQNVTTGLLSGCVNGTWQAIGGGSGTFTALTGDATSTATGGATTVIGVHGAVVPLSAVAVATNASRQLVAASVQGSGDTKVMLAGTVSGLAATLCTDANGGATTTGCSAGGGGNTTSTSLTTNTLPKANGANSIIDSTFTDNGTTAATSEPFQAPSVTTTGTTAGIDAFGSGTQTIPGTITNMVGFIGPASAPTGNHLIQPAVTGSAGNQFWLLAAESGGISIASLATFNLASIAATFSLPLSLASSTLSCPTCVVASSPGVGLAHFAGGTQTATSSAVNLAGADVTGLLPHANIASTAVTPGSYTSANITVAADGSITAAANGSGGGGSGGGVSGWSGLPITFVSTATQYAPPVGGALTSATESTVQLKASAAATITGLQVSITAQLGASATLAVTLRDAGVSTALTCTTASGGTTCTDTTHSVNVAQGDLLSFLLAAGGTVTAGLPQVEISVAVGTSGVGVTAVTGSAGIASSGGTTPNITLASQSNATVLANVSGGSAAPTAVAIPTAAHGLHTDANGTPGAQTAHDLSAIHACADSSGSGTAQSCTSSPSFTPATNDCILYTTTTTNSGTGLTTNVNSLGAKSIAIPGASGWTTTLTANIIPANKPLLACYDGTNWNVQQTGTASAGGTSNCCGLPSTSTLGSMVGTATAGSNGSYFASNKTTCAATAKVFWPMAGWFVSPAVAVNAAQATSGYVYPFPNCGPARHDAYLCGNRPKYRPANHQ